MKKDKRNLLEYYNLIYMGAKPSNSDMSIDYIFTLLRKDEPFSVLYDKIVVTRGMFGENHTIASLHESILARLSTRKPGESLKDVGNWLSNTMEGRL